MEDFSELYYQHPFVKEFDAQVVACREHKGGGYEIELSQTAFYPEGGGQPGDRGTLIDEQDRAKIAELEAQPLPADADDAARIAAQQALQQAREAATVQVTDTIKVGNAQVHITDKPLAVGATVHGELDWQWRMDNMQGHTGEHMVSGLVHAAYGYNNVGFHLGEDVITVDFDGPLTEQQALEIEQRANAAVWANIPIKELYPSREELASINYRSKKELDGVVRLVSIPGVDLCACCGTHTLTTGEVGIIKIVNLENYKGGVRLSLLCGRRALLAWEREMEQVKTISVTLSAKPAEVQEAVSKLWAEKDELRKTVKAANQKYLDAVIAGLSAGDDSDVVIRFEDQMGSDELRYLCNQVIERGVAQTCAALSAVPGSETTGEDGVKVARYNYVIASTTVDLRAAVKELNARLNGRGGGKPAMVQGSFVSTQAQIEAALNELLQ